MAKVARIDLMGHVGAGVILEWPSGVAYGNQSGGTYCLQPSYEGIFVPWFNDVELETQKVLGIGNTLFDRVWGRGGCSGSFSEAEADVLDGILAQAGGIGGVRVDRARLADSWEAWVHVTIAPDTDLRQVVDGLDPFPSRGVLIWDNSD